MCLVPAEGVTDIVAQAVQSLPLVQRDFVGDEHLVQPLGWVPRQVAVLVRPEVGEQARLGSRLTSIIHEPKEADADQFRMNRYAPAAGLLFAAVAFPSFVPLHVPHKS